MVKKLSWCITLFCIHYNAYARVSKGINSLERVPVENLYSYLQNCESEASNIPRTAFDLVMNAVGLGKHNKLAQARECLEQRLQEVTKEICQEKEDVYTQYVLQNYLLFWSQEDIYTQDQRYKKYDQRDKRFSKRRY